MISRDYTKEVGIPSHKKTMPRAVAFVVLAAVAIGVTFGVAGVLSRSKEHHATEKRASAPAVTPGTPAAAPAATGTP